MRSCGRQNCLKNDENSKDTLTNLRWKNSNNGATNIIAALPDTTLLAIHRLKEARRLGTILRKAYRCQHRILQSHMTTSPMHPLRQSAAHHSPPASAYPAMLSLVVGDMDVQPPREEKSVSLLLDIGRVAVGLV